MLTAWVVVDACVVLHRLSYCMSLLWQPMSVSTHDISRQFTGAVSQWQSTQQMPLLRLKQGGLGKDVNKPCQL